MSKFGYTNNTTTNSSTKKNNTISKKVFKETITYIEEKWDLWSKEIETLNNDCESLQRMFMEYDKDNRYLELRNDIHLKIQEKKSMLLTLEKLVLNIKGQIGNT